VVSHDKILNPSYWFQAKSSVATELSHWPLSIPWPKCYIWDMVRLSTRIYPGHMTCGGEGDGWSIRLRQHPKGQVTPNLHIDGGGIWELSHFCGSRGWNSRERVTLCGTVNCAESSARSWNRREKLSKCFQVCGIVFRQKNRFLLIIALSKNYNYCIMHF